MDILTLAIAKNKFGSANETITTENITNALGYKPANQEEMRKLSEEIADLKENGTGGGVVVSSVEPETDDIPKVFFSEAIPQTKDDATTALRYISKTKDISGYAEFKAQGNSSMSHPKKNMTVKMYSDEALSEKLKVDFKGWGKQAKHVYKANWIDLTQARNIVSARLWADVVKSRENYAELPELLRTSPNHGAIDGFPVKVYSKGIYQGRYTLNIPKDAWMANMDDALDNHCILCGENYVSGCFRATANINGNDWSDEVHDTVPNSIKTRWNEVISFVMNSTDEEFVANLENYFFVDSLIDYFIFGMVSCGLDAFGKNQLYFTYDGMKWIASMYDMDSTWGLYWNGSKFVSASYTREEFEDFVNTNGNLLYVRLAQLFYERIQLRYAELKDGALSVPNIINHFERFTDIAPMDLVKEDYASTTGGGKFTGIPSKDTNNIQQIRKFVVDRYAYCDEYIANLGTSEPDIPDEPDVPDDVTLTSISATYTGGEVPVGTTLIDLTGITVTAIYSDGTTVTVNDYTLSGEIAEGNNTITVSYGGKTATITVVGVPEEPLPEGMLYSLSRPKTFDGTNYIDTGVQLFDVDKPFTVCVDWTHTGENIFGMNSGVIVYCMHEESPWYGLTVKYATESIESLITQNSTCLVKANKSEIKVNSRIRTVISKDSNGKVKIKARVDENKVTKGDATLTFTTVNETLLLGCYQATDGTKGRFAKGILNDCKVYDYALSDEEINAFLMSEEEPDTPIIPDEPTEDTFVEEYLAQNYSPNGASFSHTVEDISLSDGDYIEAKIDLSTCTGTNENVLSIGKSIANWAGTNYHLYYSKSNNTLNINVTAPINGHKKENIVCENNINTIKINKDGIYLNDNYCELPDLGSYDAEGVYEEAKTILENVTTIQVGSQEGTTRSNATYEYIKVVRKES